MECQLRDGQSEYITLARDAQWAFTDDEYNAFQFLGDWGRTPARVIFDDSRHADILQKCRDCGCVAWTVLLS